MLSEQTAYTRDAVVDGPVDAVVDPAVLLGLVNNPTFGPVVDEVSARLDRGLEAVVEG